MSIKLMMTLEEVLEATTLAQTAWYQLMNDGKAPRPRQLTKGRVAWRTADIEKFVDALPEGGCLPPANAGQYDRAAAKAKRMGQVEQQQAGA
jgi:predicted DNA-binding transcriptional regulator AlpA